MQAQAIQNIAAENYLDAVALAAFAEYENVEPDELAEAFEEAYAGTWNSVAEWAENFMDDTGYLSEMPENLRCYFDFSAWARDAMLNGDIWTTELENGDIAVFWRQ